MQESLLYSLNKLCFELFGLEAEFVFDKGKLTYSLHETESGANTERNNFNPEKIRALAARITNQLNPAVKRQFIIILLSLCNTTPQKVNVLLNNIRLVSNNFGIAAGELEEYILLQRTKFPPSQLYKYGLLAGNSNPGIGEQLKGLKFKFFENCPGEFWIYKMQNARFFLVKTIRNESQLYKDQLEEGSLVLLDERLKKILTSLNIPINNILVDINQEILSLYDFKIPQSDLTPALLLDSKTPKIEISGRSLMLDADTFYAPVFEWLNSFRYNKHTNLEVHIAFDLINTKTCRMLATLFYRCKELESSGVNVNYYWVFPSDDPDMKQTGLDMQALIESKFNFIQTEGLYE